MNNNIKIGIIGLGAIGSYFASKLKLGKISPVVYIKKDNYINDKVNIIYRENNKIHKQNFIVGNKNDDIIYDILFITVKSYNLNNVIKEYETILNNSKNIVLIQSNLNIKNLNWKNNESKIYIAPVLVSVLGDYRSIVYEINKGTILLGKLNNKNNYNNINIISSILKNIAPTTLSENIELDLFFKIIINTSLFPLSILNSCNFGLAYKEKVNLKFASKIFYEGILLARKLYRISDKAKFYDYYINEINLDNAFDIIKNISIKYSNVFPSILIDIIKEKDKNELSYFYDDIISLSKKYGTNASNIKFANDILKCFCKKKIFFDLENIEQITKYYRQQCI